MMKSFIQKYLILVIFVLLTIVGIIVRYSVGKESRLWEFWSVIDVSLAVSLGVMAFLGYKELISSEDEIAIYFQVDNKKIETGLSLLRKDFCRSELMGVLGMIRIDDSKPYSIASLKDKKILKSLHDLQKGKDMQFVLMLGSEELAQFQ